MCYYRFKFSKWLYAYGCVVPLLVSLKFVFDAWLVFCVDVANVPELNLCFWLVTLVNVVMV